MRNSFVLGPVNNIIDYFLTGAGNNRSYSKLGELVDKFGSRISGSDSLEQAIGVCDENYRNCFQK